MLEPAKYVADEVLREGEVAGSAWVEEDERRGRAGVGVGVGVGGLGEEGGVVDR